MVGSWTDWELTDLGKKHAKNIVLASHGVSAVGYYSDVDWLSYCVNSVAVANAIDEVKAVANYVCGDCDDDGVAKWLEENVL